MKLKTSKGITLIALIITIIVLLILAGVAVASLTGENGLLNKAETAKETTAQKTAEEQVKLAIMASYNASGKIDLGELKENLNNIEGVTEITEEITDASFPLSVTVNGEEVKLNKAGETITAESNETTTPTTPSESEPEPGTVKYYAKAAMPDGASIKAGTTKETGIVMVDSNENEWVWIEVPETVFTTATTATDYDAIKADLIAYATDYREGQTGQGYSWSDEWYAKDGSTLVTASTEGLTDTQKALNNGCGLTYDEYNTAYQKMLNSIYTNKGFYISRYEAGIEGSDTDISKKRTARTAITSTSPKAVSKPDMIPYNYVYCSDAQTLASSMATGSKTSSLMFGIQWDLVCKYLEVNGNWDTTTNTASYYIKTNSKSWGNYSNATFNIDSINAKKYSTWESITGEKSGSVLLTTGASEYTNKMNIYDFAGNEYEWTLEHATTNSSSPCACRGGYYIYTGSDTPASSRSYGSTTNSSFNIGFRCSLY